MTKVYLALLALLVWVAPTTAHADTIIWYGPYLTRTYQIDEPGAAVYRPSGNLLPSWGASGGCWLDTVRKPNGRVLTLGVKCYYAGTVYATYPAMPPCNSMAGLLRNGVLIVSDRIGPAC